MMWLRRVPALFTRSALHAQLAAGQLRNALVLGVDTLSKVTDYTDRSTCVLLGDGGGAVVLKPVPEGRGLLSFYLRAEGVGKNCCRSPPVDQICPPRGRPSSSACTISR